MCIFETAINFLICAWTASRLSYVVFRPTSWMRWSTACVQWNTQPFNWAAGKISRSACHRAEIVHVKLRVDMYLVQKYTMNNTYNANWKNTKKYTTARWQLKKVKPTYFKVHDESLDRWFFPPQSQNVLKDREVVYLPSSWHQNEDFLKSPASDNPRVVRRLARIAAVKTACERRGTCRRRTSEWTAGVCSVDRRWRILGVVPRQHAHHREENHRQ